MTNDIAAPGGPPDPATPLDQPRANAGTPGDSRPGPGDLEEQARAAIDQLAVRDDPEAFQALLRLSALVGESLGVNARALATSGSWAKVAEVAGTSRQAAWSRWSS